MPHIKGQLWKSDNIWRQGGKKNKKKQQPRSTLLAHVEHSNWIVLNSAARIAHLRPINNELRS